MIRQFAFITLCVVLLFSCGEKQSANDKKVFKYNYGSGITSLDPAFADKLSNIWATTQIFNGLFELSEDLHPHPVIASEWNVSDDGLVYTFKIKEGVRFHDHEVFAGGKGRELVASDFVYTFKRLLDPSVASTGRWVFYDKVLRDENGNISDTCFKAVDDYTLKIYLKDKFPPMLELLTMPYTFVVPKEVVEKYGKDFREHPIGTGPFKLKEWDQGNSLVLLKNENYWRRDIENKPLPYLDAIQVKFIEDPNQAFREFKSGNLDFISGLAENAKEMLDNEGNIKNEFKDQFNIDKVPYMNTEYLGFYMDEKAYNGDHPFLNKKVRQALSYAINRRDLVYTLRNGLGIPGNDGIIPPALSAYDSAAVMGYQYNIEKAQNLLKEAGYPNGEGIPELELYTYPSDKQIAEYIQKQWEGIGVKLKINMTNFAAQKEMVESGKAHLFRASWIADYPDAENYLGLFYSKNFTPNGPNKTHFSNERFDELYLESHAKEEYSKNPFLLRDVYHKMDNLLMEEAPVIVLYYDEVLRIYNKKIKGMKTSSTNVLNLETVDFE